MNASLQREDAGRFAPDGAYAYSRLGLSLLVGAVTGAGMWAIIVVLPAVQSEFGVDRAEAALPYTVMMLALAAGTILWGRMSDRIGFATPAAIAGGVLGAGFVAAGAAPTLPSSRRRMC